MMYHRSFNIIINPELQFCIISRSLPSVQCRWFGTKLKVYISSHFLISTDSSRGLLWAGWTGLPHGGADHQVRLTQAFEMRLNGKLYRAPFETIRMVVVSLQPRVIGTSELRGLRWAQRKLKKSSSTPITGPAAGRQQTTGAAHFLRLWR